MANKHSFHKRYTGNQATCKPTDTRTDQTTGDSSPCHTYPNCHTICHPSKYTETKLNDRCPSKVK